VGNCPSTIRARAARDPIRSSIDIFLNYTDYRCGNQSANTKYSQPVNLAPLKYRTADGPASSLRWGSGERSVLQCFCGLEVVLKCSGGRL
jgi:hypothetical protein